MRTLVLTKRQYMNRDLIDDRFGRFREIPFALSEMGHRVTGLCLSYKKREEGRMRDGNVRWESVNAGRFKLFGLVRYIARAARKARRADVIWACSDSIYGIIGLWAARRHRIPLVFDLYDNFEFFLAGKLPLVKQLYRRAVLGADAVTCISAPLKTLVHSYGRKENVTVLSNAVRADLFRPMNRAACRRLLDLPVEAAIVGTAGALETNRGIQDLLDAFHRLQAKRPDLHLALAGPRNISIPVHGRIHDLGVLPLEKVPQLLNALNVAVICNRDNAFGRYCHPQKAVEIMACDVPLVAARVGSMAMLLADKPEWLYDPDDPTSLVRSLEHRLADQATDYPPPPTWRDQAVLLDRLLRGAETETLA